MNSQFLSRLIRSSANPTPTRHFSCISSISNTNNSNRIFSSGFPVEVKVSTSSKCYPLQNRQRHPTGGHHEIHRNAWSSSCMCTCTPLRCYSSTSSQPAYNFVQVFQTEGLRKIVMNDKKTRNALSLQLMTELIAAINADKSDPNLRGIVVTSNSEIPVFSSGHNLKELTTDKGLEAQKKIFETCTELMLSIRNSEVPVICVVRGLAAAAGCQLVAACDFAIVSEKSSFSTPGASFGLFCSTPGVSVSRAANRQTAAFMVLTGQSLTANEALNAGLVTKVVPEEKLDLTVDEIYASIKSKSRSVIHFGKQFFYKQLEMPYSKALKEGENAMVENLQFQDCQEGLESFKGKRHPTWTHLCKTVN